MYFRRLRYFEAVARCGSFSRASHELHVAQPALSSQIAELEADFGLQLFTRHSRGVTLTEAGEALLPRAEQVREMIEQMRAEMMAFRSVVHGEVRLGLPTTITSVLALPLMAAVAERLPGITLHVVEGMTGHLEKWLEHGDLDAAILFRPPSLQPQLAPVGTEGLVLIGATNDMLEPLIEVSLATIGQLPLVHTTRAHHLRQMLDEHSLKLKIPLRIVAEIDSLAQIKTMVFQKRGYTVLPKISMGGDWASADVRSWPVSDPDLRLKLFVVTAAHLQGKPHCRAAVALVEDVTRALILGGTWVGASVDDAARPPARPKAVRQREAADGIA